MELNIQGESMNNEMMKSLHNLCDFIPKYYNFPGSLPVSLSKNDLKFLKRNYTVCDKTDGSRYFLFGFDKNMYFVDRLMNVYYLGKMEYNNFVYDGELVKHKYNDNIWYYVIFDVFCHNNKVVKDIANHESRITYIMNNHPMKCVTGENELIITVKRFYLTKDINLCIKNVYNYEYKTDGYIFTPIYRKIFNGTDKRTYKWKNGTDHTIDFELQRDGKIYLWNNKNEKICIGILGFDDSNIIECEKIKDCDIPFIVECKFVLKVAEGDSQWIFIKHRVDKNRPNSMKTYLSTINVINENITEQDLNFNLSY